MDIYAKNILDHYQRPRNFGPLSGVVGHHELNHSCGDDITVYLKTEAGKIKQLSFEGHGCSISMATTSILSEALVGREIAEVLKLDLSDIQKILGIDISLRREKCALIGLRAIQGAVKESILEISKNTH